MKVCLVLKSLIVPLLKSEGGVQTSAWSPSDVNSCVTVISFFVRVPVLSEHITLQQPEGHRLELQTSHRLINNIWKVPK